MQHSQVFRLLALIALGFVLAACGTTRSGKATGGGVYKVGDPYEVGGNWYYPQADPSYDQTGIASYYGNELRGARTANGERFDPDALTAAHRTLPLPSNVRVTNLDNGKSLIVRVNDRGPFKAGRLIDVSAHAADLLGFKARGTGRVRVQFVGIGDIDGRPPPAAAEPSEVAAAAPPPPPPVAKPPPPKPPPPLRGPEDNVPVPRSSPLDEPTGVVTKVAVRSGDRIFVQAGSFAARDNAERLQARLKKIAAFKISPVAKNGQMLYRVRSGPYKTVGEADSILDLVLMDGQKGADIVVE